MENDAVAAPDLADGLRLTFLGTGTSVGVPMVGCECAVCHSDDPRDKRFRSSVLIETPELRWIIDTGPDLRSQCLRAGIRHLDCCLLTHAHTDHVAGFDDLRRFCVAADAVIPVHASAACLETVAQMFEFAFNGQNRYIGYLKPEPHAITGPFWLGGTLVTPLPVIHGKVQCQGYLFTRGGRKLLAYVPDVKVFPETTLELMHGVEVFVCDALRHTDHPTHMTLDEATAAARAIRARRTWFTHFQCQVGHAETEEKLPPDIRLAYDGLILTLPLDPP